MKPNPRDRPKTSRSFGYHQRIVFLGSLAALPGLALALYFIWQGAFSFSTRLLSTILLAGFVLTVLLILHERAVYPLRTLSNILAGLRDEDYSIRARGANRDDAMGEVMIEVNTLGESLREQRLGALEALALLRTIMNEIDVAIFTFDGEQKLRLVNRAAEKLMAQSSERLLGRAADDLGLFDCLEGEQVRTIERTFPGGFGRWSVRRSSFREKGLPNQLVVLADLSKALREEERQAWQRLLRVLGHELNNSLAPIKSIAGTMGGLLKKNPLPEDWQEDMGRGLEIISTRAEALNRFIEAYTRIARLPQPRVKKVAVRECILRVAALETRLKVTVQPGPVLQVQADPDQLDQLLINLLRNAVDAALETGGGVTLQWGRTAAAAEITILDEGPGLSNTANLFVPFFTTKPGGSGIGLILSRQIAEAHGGGLTLENRSDRPGCIARLRLPSE